jgi:hypothetical protein
MQRIKSKYVNIKVVSSERGEGAGEILFRFGYSLCRRVLRDRKDRLFAEGPLIVQGNQQVAINKYCSYCVLGSSDLECGKNSKIKLQNTFFFILSRLLRKWIF